MREFGVIHVGFWEWTHRHKISDKARIIGAYLLSCRHGNSLGCYRIPKEYVSADLGFSIDRVLKGYTELYQYGFILYCDHTSYCFIPKYLKWNAPQNPKHAKGILRCAGGVPTEFQFWPELIESIEKYLSHRLDENGKHTLYHTLSKRYGNTDTDTDTDTHTNTDTHTEESRGSDEGFTQEIADAFAEILPELVPPRGIKLTPDLRKQIRARWDELAERRGIDWWRGYFQDVRSCPHLMGANTSGWQASISWMTKPRNMTKVLAGEYRRSARAKNAKPLDQGLAEKDYTTGAERWDQGSVQ